ncbi:MAG: hypothetical protein ABII01_02270 [Candidatus Woesearchaeota archaeon]
MARKVSGAVRNVDSYMFIQRCLKKLDMLDRQIQSSTLDRQIEMFEQQLHVIEAIEAELRNKSYLVMNTTKSGARALIEKIHELRRARRSVDRSNPAQLTKINEELKKLRELLNKARLLKRQARRTASGRGHVGKLIFRF